MFNQDKTLCLNKAKKKKKGVDENVADLIKLGNWHHNYYSIMAHSSKVELELKRVSSKKLFISHNAVDFIPVWKVLSRLPKGNVWFKYSPLLMHVVCRDLPSAEKLVKVGKIIPVFAFN